ncbi:MAG: coiled-coil domain-containing protein, partial [Armatimonadota bacterium]
MANRARLICVTAAIAIAAAVPAAVFGAKKSALSSKIKKAKQIKAQISAVRHKIRIKESEKRTVIGQLTVTEAKLETAQSNLARNKLRLLDARADLNATIKRLERTRKQLARRRALLTRRVIDIYEGDDLDYVDVILGSADMWTFLTRAYYLKRILDADTRLIAEIRADEAAIERDRRRQAQRVSEIQG